MMEILPELLGAIVVLGASWAILSPLVRREGNGEDEGTQPQGDSK